VRGFNPISGDTRATQLLVVTGVSRCYCRPQRLLKLRKDLRVEEILDLLDLQASVFIGDDVCNIYRLVGCFRSD